MSPWCSLCSCVACAPWGYSGERAPGVFGNLSIASRSGDHAQCQALGGLAVAIGAMVDAAIVLIDRAQQRLIPWDPTPTRKRGGMRCARRPLTSAPPYSPPWRSLPCPSCRSLPLKDKRRALRTPGDHQNLGHGSLRGALRHRSAHSCWAFPSPRATAPNAKQPRQSRPAIGLIALSFVTREARSPPACSLPQCALSRLKDG